MATKSAGRVSIRVLPDSTRFREDLKKSLERIERTMKAEIPAELVVTRESVRKLKEQLRDLEVRIKVDPYITKEDLHEVKKNIEDLDPDVRVGLNTAVARARLTALTRPRTVPIFVRINRASLAAATAALTALSGARFLGNVFDKFWDSIKNIDKSAPRIALVVSGINLLAGGLLAATSNAAGLAASLAALGQAAVLLPALMTSAGISIGVLIAALKDTKTVLADLGPSFNNLQDIISNQFWAQAAQPIREMVNSLMPTLNVQLGNLAAAWGRVFASLSQSIQTSVTPDKLTFMMENLTRAVDIASRAMAPLVNAFTTLGMFGSQYLPRLSEWFVKLSEDFNRFITEAAADGSLDRWAERGIKEFKALGRVLKETVRVFAALSRAAEQAGGAGFEQLANGLQKLADTMNTSNFQTTLATLFYGAHRLMDGLIDGLDRLGPGLANFAPTLASVFNTTGKIVGQFLEDIGILLSSPELQAGMQRFFGSFLTFLTDLKPAMAPLGEVLGIIGDIAGTFLSEFGLLIADVAPGVASVFGAVWEAIKPLVPTLAELVRDLLPPFSEILLVLAKDVLPPVVDLIKKLAPGIAELVRQITPQVSEFMRDFAGSLREFNDEIKPDQVVTFAQQIGELTRNVEDFLNTASSPRKTYEFLNSEPVKKFNDEVNQALENFWRDVDTNIRGLNDRVNQGLEDFWRGLGEEFTRGIEGLNEDVTQMASDIWQGFVNGLRDGAVAIFGEDIVNGFTSWVNDVMAFFGIASPSTLMHEIGMNIVQGFVNGLMAIVGMVGEVWGNITTTIQQWVETIKTNVQNFINDVVTNWNNFWNGLPGVVQTTWTNVSSTVSTWVGQIGSNISSFIQEVIANWNQFWTNVWNAVTTWTGQILGNIGTWLGDMVSRIVTGASDMLTSWGNGLSQIWESAVSWFEDIVGAIGNGITNAVNEAAALPGKILDAIGGFGQDFLNAGAAMIGNLAEGIRGAVGGAIDAVAGVIAAVTDFLPGSPAKRGPLSGRGYSRIRGQHLVEDLVTGMRERTDTVQTAGNAIASAASLSVNGAAFTSAGSAAGVPATTTGAALVNIEGDYYGATPEKVASEFDRKIRRANLVSQIRGVSK